MEGVSETLAGRIAILRLYPFNWLEMQSMPGANQELAKDDGKMADEVVRGFYPEFFRESRFGQGLVVQLLPRDLP